MINEPNIFSIFMSSKISFQRSLFSTYSLTIGSGLFRAEYTGLSGNLLSDFMMILSL